MYKNNKIAEINGIQIAIFLNDFSKENDSNEHLF